MVAPHHARPHDARAASAAAQPALCTLDTGEPGLRATYTAHALTPEATPVPSDVRRATRCGTTSSNSATASLPVNALNASLTGGSNPSPADGTKHVGGRATERASQRCTVASTARNTVAAGSRSDCLAVTTSCTHASSQLRCVTAATAAAPLGTRHALHTISYSCRAW